MRFLADENFPALATVSLRQRGHDVLAAVEVLRAAPDAQLLTRAGTEGRILLTFDKDFGELAFRSHLPAQSGIVLFRLSGDDAQSDNARVVAVLESRTDWAGRFAVVTQDRLRIRPLPRSE